MHFILLKYIHNIMRYMCFIKTGSTCPALPYDKQIENVELFKYLGAMLTNTGNSKN